MSINHWLWGICMNVLKRIFNRNCRKNMGRELANLFFKCHSLQQSKSNLIPKFQQKQIIMRKVYKTIALPIYYSLYHDKNLTSLWILYCMHSYCMKLFHCKILLCLRKECLHIPTPFFFVSACVLGASYSFMCPNNRRVYRQ